MRKRYSVLGMTVLCAITIGYDVMNSSAQSPTLFKDTYQHWAESSIQNAVQKKYVDGYEDGTFKPDVPISRAEFIKMLAMAMGEKVNKIEGDGWFQPYVDRLKSQGIIPAEFPERYNEPLQRFEMSILSVRSVDKTLKGSMVDSTKMGLIHGVSRTDLDVYGTSTRAQAITIIERILATKNGENLQVDKYAASAAEIAATGSNVGTMLGLKAREVGTEWPYGTGVTVKLNQLIIADPSDPDDPYMKLINMDSWYRETDKNKNIVVLAYFTVTVSESGVNKYRELHPYQLLTLLDTTNQLLMNTEQLKRWIIFNKPQVQMGFVAFAGKKDLASKTIEFDILGKHTVIANK
ncbi:S-layer homology domain-containing protein [Paenibacillus sp. MAH-36]|uniref:S-layer homology domain-containing protein n=1 Tax=Paenibacillus violae TaxID=3077234 RepID=A0ABU3RIJ6_9BACL|nr:S-layer homology domain-containing protein [Paenibacillus sp. PFR10]MDU0204092.1 S-layer homology domain-containing protein [Paenibacillus sp. PFR10]